MNRIYVNHFKQVPERKESILKQFGNNIEIIDKYDKTELSECKNFSDILEKHPEMSGWFKPEIFNVSKNPRMQLCLTMSFINILQKIQNSNSPGLILEDDAITLVSNPLERVDMCIKDAPPDWDVLFISDAIAGSDLRNLTVSVYGNQWVGVREARHTLAWIVSPTGAKKLLDMLSNTNALGLYPDVALDNWLSTLFRQNPLHINVWWTLCPFITNGNQCGTFDKTY